MNSLNSILIEGKVKERPIKMTSDDGYVSCTFSIDVVRNVKLRGENKSVLGDGYKEVTFVFNVVVEEPQLIKLASEIDKGREVCVVGFVENYEDTGVRFNAQHVEVRPRRKHKA